MFCRLVDVMEKPFNQTDGFIKDEKPPVCEKGADSVSFIEFIEILQGCERRVMAGQIAPCIMNNPIPNAIHHLCHSDPRRAE